MVACPDAARAALPGADFDGAEPDEVAVVLEADGAGGTGVEEEIGDDGVLDRKSVV